jgi:hypothetical protein
MVEGLPELDQQPGRRAGGLLVIVGRRPVRSQLSVDPELSLVLALEAEDLKATSEAHDALRRVLLLNAHVRDSLNGHRASVSSVAFSRDEAFSLPRRGTERSGFRVAPRNGSRARMRGLRLVEELRTRAPPSADSSLNARGATPVRGMRVEPAEISRRSTESSVDGERRRSATALAAGNAVDAVRADDIAPGTA